MLLSAGTAISADVGSVDHRFRMVAATLPDATAIIDGDTTSTYAELDAAADVVASHLDRLGVTAGCTVGVCMDRSAALLAVLFGILSRGAAYVPLDTSYPAARLDFMAEDAGTTCVVADEKYLSKFDAGARSVITARAIVDAAELPERSVRPRTTASTADSLAYIMYTSGSTGKPKGVELTNANVLAFLDAMAQLLPAEAGRLVLFSTRLAFDIAGLEIFYPLLSGGACLVARDTYLFNARHVVSLIGQHHPSLVQATPAGWRLMLDAGATFDSDQVLLCGGEALPPRVALELAASPATAYNVYGPTEATIWATYWRITSGAVAIGRPLTHCHVYVVGEDGEQVAAGEEGEAFIGGAAVARGYHGAPELTASRFVRDPWAGPGASADTRMYATGDIVRVVDGMLEFVRRKDTQVKLNGHRIELGEIEAEATNVPGVRAAAAFIIGAGGEHPSLHLCVGSAEATIDTAVRAHLRRTLPRSMWPTQISVRDYLPLNDNGKVDVGQLRRAAEAAQ